MDVSTRTYQHAARHWTDPGTGAAECRVCGDPVVCDDAGVRHAAEQAPHVTAGRTDLRAVTAALDVALSALRGLPAGVTDDDRAQAVIAALYARGALRRHLARTAREQLALFPATAVA
jgi:hypothetical protein